ncbi:hypothetical protein RRG08_064346 [Elysia crispata]|uniref:Uncharacterized protein n=1 Tax=Elysia crispata TaxID=231223 RepID=A0AAE1DJ29_9GAST|nr:hypothetical protein RRG08_064346 [Elysia crispata]
MQRFLKRNLASCTSDIRQYLLELVFRHSGIPQPSGSVSAFVVLSRWSDRDPLRSLYDSPTGHIASPPPPPLSRCQFLSPNIPDLGSIQGDATLSSSSLSRLNVSMCHCSQRH